MKYFEVYKVFSGTPTELIVGMFSEKPFAESFAQSLNKQSDYDFYLVRENEIYE